MRIRSSRFSVLIAVAIYALSASIVIAQSDGQKNAPEVRIYQSGLNPGRYELVSHLWIDSWRTAFWLPTYPSQAEAIAALQTEAARLGADGLVGVSCIDQGHPKWWPNTDPAILCYGNAVRVRKSDG